MRATAQAQPNIALVKYWGKRNVAENLPATGSLSITLRSLSTQMTVQFDESRQRDELLVNGQDASAMLPRVSACLDHLLGAGRMPAIVESTCNFPIAAGLASSAAAFAALVTAASAAAGQSRDTLSLARAAGRASGSAARSLFGGVVELAASDECIEVESILDPGDWPLDVVVAVTANTAKPVSSGKAMKISAASSPFYASWVQRQDDDLAAARRAVADRDFPALATVSEHNCLKMHSVMWASRPPVVFWNAATINCMETVRALQEDSVAVFFTVDAGPQLKAVCLPDTADRVQAALRDTSGVVDVMRSSLGDGARVLECS